MAWKFNNPLHSLATDDQNEAAKKVVTEERGMFGFPVKKLVGTLS